MWGRGENEAEEIPSYTDELGSEQLLKHTSSKEEDNSVPMKGTRGEGSSPKRS